MELSIRDWMIVIIVLLLLAVALDSYRRASRDRKTKVRLSNKAKKSHSLADGEEEKNFPSELPNGGARVIGVLDGPDIDPRNPPLVASERRPIVHKPDPRVEAILGKNTITEVRQEPTFGQASEIDNSIVEDVTLDMPVIDDVLIAAPIEPEKSSKKERKRIKHNNDAQPSLFDDDKRASTNFEEIIVLNVLAKNTHGFSGKDLLHILLPCDCRLGAMNIFHRYESERAKGEVQFSIVNIVEPGVFNLDNIDEFSTPGVSFFLRLPGPQDPIEAFNCMVETAQCLVRNLNGELKDERHSTVTQQTLEHAREKIHHYIKRQMIGL